MAWFSRMTSKSASLSPTEPKRYTERDNVGTRYELKDDVSAYSMSNSVQGLESPYIRFYFDERDAAVAALTSVPCIHVASDSGKLISTEPIDFGLYPTPSADGTGRIATWGVLLAGRHVTLEMFDIAVAACQGNKGNELKVRGRPAASPNALDAESSANASAAIFVRLEQGNIGGRSITKKIYSAPSKASALAFLQKQTVSTPFFYIEVETPEGRFGRDLDGIYG
jgi:hypothetical protein